MSKENVEKFYSLLSEDKELLERVTKASEKLKNRLTTKGNVEEKDFVEVYNVMEPFAREVNCPFTLAEFESYKKEKFKNLTQEELDALVGGVGMCVCVISGSGEGCGCELGGGGGGGGRACVCVIGGGGGGK